MTVPAFFLSLPAGQLSSRCVSVQTFVPRSRHLSSCTVRTPSTGFSAMFVMRPVASVVHDPLSFLTCARTILPMPTSRPPESASFGMM